MDKVANWVIVLLRKLKSRTFAAVLLTLSLALTVIQLTVLTRAVYIRDGEETILKFTIRQDADDILEENGIATMACDIVDFDGFHGRVGEISITRAFPVEITADGSQWAMPWIRWVFPSIRMTSSTTGRANRWRKGTGSSSSG